MSLAGSTTYSYKDITGSITFAGDTYDFVGQKGVRSIAINMNTDQSSLDTAADGAVVNNEMVGDSATITVEVQQTSALDEFFLTQYNILKAAKQGGDVSLAASGAVLIRAILGGRQHIGLGVSFTKIPTRTYAAAAGYLSWVFNVSDLQNT